MSTPYSLVFFSQDINATMSYVQSLRMNNTMLLNLAIVQLPHFGVNPGSIRSALLNATTVKFGFVNNTIGNTTIEGNQLLIRLEYTATVVSHACIFVSLSVVFKD